MEAHWEQRTAFSARPHRRPRPNLEDRLIARLLAPWLDRELARGLGGSLSEVHAARAAQLSGERARRAVARLLDRLVDHAQEARPTRVFIAPCPDQVRRAMPLIDSIRTRLRSSEPLDARVIAQLRTLLTDRDGPCYAVTEPDALKVALEEISATLTSEQQRAASLRSRSSESDRRTAA